MFFDTRWRLPRWWPRADSSGLQRLWTSWRGRAGWVWGRRRWGRQGCGRKHRPPGRLLRRLKARARPADKLTTLCFSHERGLAQVAQAELVALLLQVLRLPLHPLLAERHRVHLLLQLVAQNRRGFLARLLVLKKPKLTFKMEPESCPNLETCALAESFVHLAYPRLKAMKEEVGVRSFQKTFPI